MLVMLQVAEGAKSAGASRIIGIDIDSKRFDVGKFRSRDSPYSLCLQLFNGCMTVPDFYPQS